MSGSKSNDLIGPFPVTASPKTMRAILIMTVCAALMAFSALLVSLNRPEPPVFASVSVKQLLEHRLRTTVDPSLSTQEVEMRTGEYVIALQSVLNEYGNDNGIVLLATEAVLGETLPDFTDIVGEDAYERSRAMAESRGVFIHPMGVDQAVSQRLDILSVETAKMTERISGFAEQGRNYGAYRGAGGGNE